MESAPLRTVLAPVAAFLLTWLALHVLLRSGIGARLADEPNARSLHKTVIPRIGGLGMLCGLTAAVLILGIEYRPIAALAAGYAALAFISVLDDIRSLPALARLAAHLAVAAAYLQTQPLPAAAVLAAALGLAWCINLYNFMDGSDGLAGGMAAFGFGAFACLFAIDGVLPMTGLCAALAFSAVGFLLYNFHPARLFLGDSGSIPLGFCAGAIGLTGVLGSDWPVWTPIIIFFPFVFDATFTLLRRALRRERLWQAHREHLYQRAILAGLGHRRLALRAYGLMFGCAALGIASAQAGNRVAGLIIGAQTLTGLALAWRVDRVSKPRTPAA